MEIFNADQQKNLEINNLLQEIRYVVYQNGNTDCYYPMFMIDNNNVKYLHKPSQQPLLEELETLGAIKMTARSLKEINNDIDELRTSNSKILISEGYNITIIEPIFSQLCEEYAKRCNEYQTIKVTENNDKKQTYKFPYKLPAGTKWENFIVKFEDTENVHIQIKQFKHYASYREMGFIGRGTNPKPSEAWTFLKVLAELNGEITLKNPEARDKYKKQKELLSKTLQSYFSLDYDPFYPYRSSLEKYGNSYKIKIVLWPLIDKKEEKIIDENEDDLGIKEYLDGQAPQIYEDE